MTAPHHWRDRTILAYLDEPPLSSPKREEVFGPLGVTNIRTFVGPQYPSRVAVPMDVPDMAVTAAAMQSPEMVEAMEHDGVVADSPVILVEA
jgi:hypothetical protein